MKQIYIILDQHGMVWGAPTDADSAYAELLRLEHTYERNGYRITVTPDVTERR